MATKATKAPKRPARKSVQKSRIVTSKKQKPSKLRRVLNGKFGLLLAAIAIGLAGTYLLSQSHADSIAGTDNPARGVFYHGQRVKTAGSCVGQLDDDMPGNSDGHRACTHPDPGPEDVDVREREKHVDADLAKQVAYDKTHPAVASNDAGPGSPPLSSPADVGAAGDLSSVSPRNWPCVGTGNDGARVTAIYVYKTGNTNRISTVRPGFEGVARRMNAVMYNSAVSNGTARQIRFQTSSTCALTIYTVSMSAADIDGFGTVKSVLRAKGFHLSNHKYLVWIDGAEANGGCGYGDSWYDDSPSPSTNYNNKGNMFAVVWHKCWNYSEPHELMHTLGAVSTYYKDPKTGTVFSTNAPYNTPGGHCYDQHDIMCYNDGSGGHAMQTLCAAAVNIWRYDCNKNTYFNAGTPTGWLANHWNTANSSYLLR